MPLPHLRVEPWPSCFSPKGQVKKAERQRKWSFNLRILAEELVSKLDRHILTFSIFYLYKSHYMGGNRPRSRRRDKY